MEQKYKHGNLRNLSSEKLSDLSEQTQWPTHLSIKASHSDTTCLCVWMESAEKREIWLQEKVRGEGRCNGPRLEELKRWKAVQDT